MSLEPVQISVHERLDAPGFVVLVVHSQQVVKFPVDTFNEAEALAVSIRDGINAGIPLEALMAGAEEEEP